MKEANEAQPDDASDLETRRHTLSNRWVRATVRHVRAEHPDWPAVKVANAARGRPRRIDHGWKIACGHDPAGANDPIPRGASPEKIRQLAEQLDREEAELAAQEPRYPAKPPRT